MLLEVSETTVVLSGSGDDLIVALPKREQTLDEVEKTRKFAQECVALLRHAPDCRLPFNKFIPSYHHHFGKQCRYTLLHELLSDKASSSRTRNDYCRVSDYGFTKLIELFEAVPNTIEVTEDADGERLLQLTDSERITVVGEQISALIEASQGKNVC